MAPDGVIANLLGDGQIVGSEKYLGGVLGADGCVYGVPGKARQVLKIVPETGEVCLIGPSFQGHFKWLRGVQCGSAVYCIPCHHERVLKIDTSTGEVSLIGDSFPGLFKWHGAVVARDGSIFAIPQKAEYVLRIDPRTDTTKLIGPSLGGVPNKWYGGLIDHRGSIWGVPTNADGALKIVPRGDSADVSLVGSFGGVSARRCPLLGLPSRALACACSPRARPLRARLSGRLQVARRRDGARRLHLWHPG